MDGLVEEEEANSGGVEALLQAKTSLEATEVPEAESEAEEDIQREFYHARALGGLFDRAEEEAADEALEDPHLLDFAVAAAAAARDEVVEEVSSEDAARASSPSEVAPAEDEGVCLEAEEREGLLLPRRRLRNMRV